MKRFGPPCSFVLISAISVSLLAGRIAAGADDLNHVTIKPSPQHPPIAIVENGEARAAICIMNVPNSQPFTHALKELQTAVEATTGAVLPIYRIQPGFRGKPPVKAGKTPVTVAKMPEGPAIVLGACDEALAAGLDGAKMPVEGFAIKTAHGKGVHRGARRSGASLVGHGLGRVRVSGTVRRRPLVLAAGSGRPLGRAEQNLVVPPAWLEDAPVFRKREIWPPIANTWTGGGSSSSRCTPRSQRRFLARAAYRPRATLAEVQGHPGEPSRGVPTPRRRLAELRPDLLRQPAHVERLPGELRRPCGPAARNSRRTAPASWATR